MRQLLVDPEEFRMTRPTVDAAFSPAADGGDLGGDRKGELETDEVTA
jgi:hypothetical protein